MPGLSSVIALVGAFAGHPALIALLEHGSYETLRVTGSDDLVDRLLDRYPVLILVDGQDAGWERWAAAIKAEQALRRLHVLIVTPDDSAAPVARSVGADGVLPGDTAGEDDLRRQIEPHIRRLEPEIADQLACQCRESLPPLARLGVERFNAGAYYAQHDAFEAQWMAEPGPVRDLYRAVLQVGVAYYHITRGNPVGALRMLRRCVQWFAVLPDDCQGIDVRQLREDAAQVRAALLAMNPGETGASVDPALLRPIRLLDSV